MPPKSQLLHAVQACGMKRVLSDGRSAHDAIIRCGLHLDVAITSTVIDMYARCGSLLEANKVFDSSPNRNVVTWNAMIMGYARAGQGAIALRLFEGMCKDAIQPTKVTFLSVMKACGALGDIEQGNTLHDQVVERGLDSDIVVGNTTVDLYAKCGCLKEASKVFEELKPKDVVSWNTIISGYAQSDHGASALDFFNRMQKAGVKPDLLTFSCVLKACGSLEDLSQGIMIHKQLIRSRLELDTVVRSTLVDMYAKCGNLQQARVMFDILDNRNCVLYGAMIAGYAQHGYHNEALKLVEVMLQNGTKPDMSTFPCILNSCTNTRALEQGKVIHNQILERALEMDISIGNALIDMYVKCGNLQDADQVFGLLAAANIISWNSMIIGYVHNDQSFAALDFLNRMIKKGIQPDKVTFLGGLRACANVNAVEQGKRLHLQTIYSGIESDTIVGSTLVDMYVKWGKLNEAQIVFNSLPGQDLVACAAMITGYVQHGDSLAALRMYEFMQQKGLKPDDITVVGILKACASTGLLEHGKLIHHQVMKWDFDGSVLVGNALIDMYAKCGSETEAQSVFDHLPNKNVTSWNAMMTGYTQQEDAFMIFDLFEEMHRKRTEPNKVSYLCILKACGIMGTVRYGNLSSMCIIMDCLDSDLVVGNSILDMYCKCGNLQDAHKVFDMLSNRDVVSWSAIIAGHAQHGNLRLAVQYLLDMQQEGIKPVGRTFTSILVACSHAGLVEEGHRYFKSMRTDYGISPTIEHINCLIDLLGRSGYLDDARELLQSMPVTPNITGWMSLLTSSQTFGCLELARKCFYQLVQLDPTSSSAFLLMSKSFANSNMWSHVHKLERTRMCRSAWKKPGKAGIEVHSQMLEFVAGVRSDQQFLAFSKLYSSMRMWKKGGYVPELDSILEQS